jgi:hypothetical protein
LAINDTITITLPSVTAKAASAIEFTGVDTSNAVDKTLCASGTGNNWSSGATATTSQADEIIVGGVAKESDVSGNFTFSGMSPSTNHSDTQGTSGNPGTSNVFVTFEYAIQTVASAQTEAGSFDGSTADWTACVATLKASSLGGEGSPGIVDNGSVTAMTLTAVDAFYSSITDSASYPSNAAGIGMRSTAANADIKFYEGGTLIAFLGAPVPEAALLAIPAAAFAPKILQSIKAGTFKQDTLALIEKIVLFVQKLIFGMVIYVKNKLSELRRKLKRLLKKTRQRY